MSFLERGIDMTQKTYNGFPMPECGRGMWLVAYDLRSSRAANIDDADRAWVESQRVKIWMELRYKYKCSPLQQSLWLVRDPATLDQLKNQLEIWRNLYEARGYPVRLMMVPIQTDDEGYKGFKEMELDFLLSWITTIHKQLDKVANTHKLSKKQHRLNEEKVQLVWDVIKDDFSDHERFKEASSLILMAKDKISAVKKFVPNI